MSVWKLVKLNFGRNLAHFGEVGIGLEKTSDRVRSDSLFSAWVSIYARLFGKEAVEELLRLFPTDKQPKAYPLFGSVLHLSIEKWGKIQFTIFPAL